MTDDTERAPHVDSGYDDQGVDRSQIREMLALTPVQRLRRLEAFVASTLEIRALNEHRIR